MTEERRYCHAHTPPYTTNTQEGPGVCCVCDKHFKDSVICVPMPRSYFVERAKARELEAHHLPTATYEIPPLHGDKEVRENNDH